MFPNRALTNLNQFEPEFVKERIAQLNEWLTELMKIPGISENKTLTYFLNPMNMINAMQLDAEKFKTWMSCTRTI